MKPKRSRGFTLIELMIVVAVVGILAAIAYPSYTDSIVKGRRAQGRTALAELMQQQERYMTQNNTYLAFTSVRDGTTTPAGVPFKAFSGDVATQSNYRLSAEQCPGAGSTFLALNECVRLVATPNVTDPAGENLRTTSTGAKDCTGTAWSSNRKLCWP